MNLYTLQSYFSDEENLTIYVSEKLSISNWIYDDLNYLHFTFTDTHREALAKVQPFIECGIPFALVYTDVIMDVYVFLYFDGVNYIKETVSTMVWDEVEYQHTHEAKILRSLNNFDESKIELFKVINSV